MLQKIDFCRLTLSLALAFAPQCARAANAFVQHNLVSDIDGMADHTDPGLVNPWGIATSATSPFWISDNRTGLSTLYNSAGVVNALKVTVPTPGGSGTSAPTGIVFNSTMVFNVAEGKPASFIFATEDGTISGWNSTVDMTHAVVKVDQSAAKAVYKGLAMGSINGGPVLYASNFYAGKIDVFDANFAPVSLTGAFLDPMIPAGFAPFNIQNLSGKLYVTYAKQDAAKQDDVSGPGNGYVDVFDMSGVLLQRIAAGGVLNSPWGVAIAPAGFGDFGGNLLVGNFGNGRINAFSLTGGMTAGMSTGALQDAKGNAIVIPGLWALQLGNGGNGGDSNAIYFTAGIPGPSGPVESHGLFGSLQAGPAIVSNGVVNGASFQPGIAPNTFITILGSSLASTTRTWGSADFVNGKLPTQLDGVSATVNGKPAYIYFVSPKQLNILSPVDTMTGQVQVQIMNNGLTSATLTAQMQAVSPAFFLIGMGKYIAATHGDGSVIGPAALFPGSSTPAKPGETIVLYGTGFGATNPAIPDGSLVTSAAKLVETPMITVGGAPATVTFAGLTGAGLYQINIVIPAATADGDVPVVAQAGGVSTQANALITVQAKSQ
ncbi:MAG: TIGR03118 family protein [Bryobacteraceae bacterium]